MTLALYGVVDAARDSRIYPLVLQSQNFSCLFAGDVPLPLRSAAPYVVELSDATPLKRVWHDEGWGQAWGILIRSTLGIDALRRHLRSFLLARLPDGQMALFRFYDPRVWRVYWPSCTADEKARWLRGVNEVVAEEPV